MSEEVKTDTGVDSSTSTSSNPVISEEEYKKTGNDIPVIAKGISDTADTMDELSTLNKDEVKKNFSDKDLDAVKVNEDGVDYMSYNEAGKSQLNPKTWTNNPRLGEKLINIRKLPTGGTGTSKGALSRLSQTVGIAVPVQVPLHHSGFHLTISNIQNLELVDLQASLVTEEITLGRNTNNLIYSNYNVINNDIMSKFAKDHATDYTVRIPDGLDLLDIIKVQDLYPLLLGVIKSTYPEGFTILRPCENTMTVEVQKDANDKPTNDKKIKCNRVMKATIDPFALLQVDESAILTAVDKMNIDPTTGEVYQDSALRSSNPLASRTPSSLDIETVLKYQNNLAANESQDIPITLETGEKIIITIQSPFITDYVNAGGEWVTNIIEKTTKLFTEQTTVEEKETLLYTNFKASLIGVYNSYITKITFASDGDVIDVQEDINHALNNVLAYDDNAYKILTESIKKYIDASFVSMVAIETYVCPVCKQLEPVSEDTPERFKEYLPLNVPAIFFDLCAFRNIKTLERI